MSGRDLVGGNVVAQFGIVLRSFIPGKVFASELPFNELWIFCEEKNPALRPHRVRPFLDFLVQQSFNHECLELYFTLLCRPYGTRSSSCVNPRAYALGYSCDAASRLVSGGRLGLGGRLMPGCTASRLM